MRLSYGALDDIGSDDENINELSPMSNQLPKRNKNQYNKRWSVMEKLQDRHYCRIRTCQDCQRIISFKLFLSILMLSAFIILAYSVASTLFFSALDTNRYDYILIGAGPAGSLLARKLSDYSTLNVLLLEAGGATQYSLGGMDLFGGPATIYDIPLLWPTISEVDGSTTWDVDISKIQEDPEVTRGNSNKLHQNTASNSNKHTVKQSNSHVESNSNSESESVSPWQLTKGLGGCGVHNAMIYVRALPYDMYLWDVDGWDWGRVLNKYKSMENYLIKDYPTDTVSSSSSSTSSSSIGGGRNRNTRERGSDSGSDSGIDNEVDLEPVRGLEVGVEMNGRGHWVSDTSIHSGLHKYISMCDGGGGIRVSNGNNSIVDSSAIGVHHSNSNTNKCNPGDYSKYRYTQYKVEKRRKLELKLKLKQSGSGSRLGLRELGSGSDNHIGGSIGGSIVDSGGSGRDGGGWVNVNGRDRYEGDNINTHT